MRCWTPDPNPSSARASKACSASGRSDSVEPLLPLTRGLLRGKPLRELAQLAVQAIQSRIENGDEGRLSLANPARGDLGFSAERGALACVEAGPDAVKDESLASPPHIRMSKPQLS